MRRLFPVLLAALALAACGKPSPRVMARFVPERADDFAWENELVAYRAYGEALETLDPGGTISPGFDVWVKDTSTLVMDLRYKDELERGISYHKYFHGAKDCYKVARSLGGGASSPLIGGKFACPPTNFRSFELLTGEYASDSVAFVLRYPQWEAGGYTLSLDKKITVKPGTYFCTAEDTWTFAGPAETLVIAAGIVRHAVEKEFNGTDRFAIWEPASDTGAEPEDGRIGLALIAPRADSVVVSRALGHSLCVKTVRSGEKFTYRFGSCWSKAGIKDSEAWFNLVKAQ